MVLSEEGDYTHPYQYGQLIDIFTVPVHYKGSRPIVATRRQKLHILWVQWYERDNGYQDGFSPLHLPQLSFVDESDPNAHEFIDLCQGHSHPKLSVTEGRTMLSIERYNCTQNDTTLLTTGTTSLNPLIKGLASVVYPPWTS